MREWVQLLRKAPEEKIGDLQKGIILADNLKLRLSSKEDANCLSRFPITVPSSTQYCLNRYVLECSFDVTDDPEILRKTSEKIIRLIMHACICTCRVRTNKNTKNLKKNQCE